MTTSIGAGYDSSMIQATIISNEKGTVSLSLEDGQIFSIPESAIKGGVKAGEKIYILFAAPGLETEASRDLAKEMLNSLIKSN